MELENPKPSTESALPPAPPSLPELTTGRESLADIMNIPSPSILPPVTPNGAPENIDIMDQVRGTLQTGPYPGAKSPKGTVDFIKSLSDSVTDESVKDKFKYSKQYSYGADYKNLNFERYYNHPKFKELGFSPYRDNEAIYNQKGSWWDDFNRARSQWLGIAWSSGFKGVWGNADEAAEAMNKGMAIGSSSKEGAGAWTTNLFLNSAFTVGIMGEMAVEDVALAGADVLTAGIGTPELGAIAAARDAMNVKRLGKAFAGISDFLKSLKDIEKSKQFLMAAKAGELGRETLKFLNPLEHSTAYIDQLLHSTNGLKDLQRKSKIVLGFGEFYKDLRMINMAHAEAKIEGSTAAENYQKQLIDNYYTEHGQLAEGEDAKEIYEKSKSIRAAVTLANDATIFYTNKAIFENMIERVTPDIKKFRAALKGSGTPLEKVAAENLKADANIVSKGKISIPKKIGKAIFSSAYSPLSRRYMLANLSEGIQETSQDIIQSAAKDYYDKIDKDPTQVGMPSVIASLGAGTTGEFSEQGLSTFMSGYLMEAMLQPIMGGMAHVGGHIYTKSKNAYYKTSDKTNYQKQKEEREKSDNNVVNAYNHIWKNALVYGSSQSELASKIKLAQQAKQDALEKGDMVAYEALQDQINMDKFEVLARTGNTKVFTDHIEDILNLSDEDLENAWENKHKAEHIREKLSTLKDRANTYQDRFDVVQRKMPNPYNPWRFNPKKEPLLYQREMTRYMAHNNATSDILFATEDYHAIAKKLDSITSNLTGMGKDQMINFIGPVNGINKANAQDFTIMVDSSQRRSIMDTFPEQISLLNSGNTEQKKKAAKLQEQYDILKEWNNVTKAYTKDSSPENLSSMYDIFKKYVTHIAKANNGHVFDENILKAFHDIKDFYHLDSQGNAMVATINTLADPDYFNRYVELYTKVHEERLRKKESALSPIITALGEHWKNIYINKMVNALYDIKVVPDAKGLDKFEVTEFRDAETDKDIPKDSDLYKQAMFIVETFKELNSKSVKKEPVVPKTDDENIEDFNLEDEEEPEEEVDPEKKKLYDEYNEIKTPEELKKWKDKVVSLLETTKPISLYELNALVKQKEAKLAVDLKWEDLEVGKVVIMRDNSRKVVSKIDDHNVELLSIENFKAGKNEGRSIYAKSAFKKGIKLINNEYIASAQTAEPVTQEEKKDSDKAVENIATNPQNALDNIKEAKTKSEEDLFSDLDNTIGEC